jgi:pSer/pThr/pTyr-binding forkhead associated (FHA) protein
MEGENVVGRVANCAVVLDDTSVSRQHAAVTVRGGRVTLQDMGSRNHTFLNGERVVTPVEVPPGAVIRFGVEIEATLRRA